MAIDPLASQDLTLDFGELMSIPVGQRVQAASSSQSFLDSILNSLTPFQVAEAFPDYFRKQLPDVSNFITANIDAKLGKMGRDYDQTGGGDEGTAQPYYSGETSVGSNARPQGMPAPSIEDMKKDLLKKGIDVEGIYSAVGDTGILEGDDRAKFLKGMDDKKLEEAGLQRVQTEDGKTLIKRTTTEAEALSNEEVLKRASGKVAEGTGNLEGKKKLQKQVYDAFVNAGFSDNQAKALTAEVGRENDYSERYVFGKHVDANNSEVNLGFFSWQKARGKALLERMKNKGLIDKNGAIIQSQESLNEMALFAKNEMENAPDYKRTKDQFLSNPNISQQEAAEVLGNNYIRWDMAGKKIDPGPHIRKRDEYYAQIGEINKDFPGLVPENATPDQIAAAREKLVLEERGKEAAALTELLYSKDSPTSAGVIGNETLSSTKTATQLLGGNIEIAATQVGSVSTLDERSKGVPTENVDPRLKVVGDAAIRAFEQQNPGYKIRVISADRPGAVTKSGQPSKHGKGEAIDYEIVGPDGRALPSLGDPSHPSGMGVGPKVGDYSPKYFQLMQMMEAARVDMAGRDPSYAEMGQISPGLFFKGGAWMDSMHASFGEGGALGDVYSGFKSPEQLKKEGTDPQIIEAVERAIAAGAPVQGSDKSLSQDDMKKFAQILYQTGVKPEAVAEKSVEPPKTAEQTQAATPEAPAAQAPAAPTPEAPAAQAPAAPTLEEPEVTATATPVPTEQEPQAMAQGGFIPEKDNLSVTNEQGQVLAKINEGEMYGGISKEGTGMRVESNKKRMADALVERNEKPNAENQSDQQQQAQPRDEAGMRQVPNPPKAKSDVMPKDAQWRESVASASYPSGTQGRAFKRSKFMQEGYHFNRATPGSQT